MKQEQNNKQLHQIILNLFRNSLSLPLFALIYVLFIAYKYDYEKSTYTHCDVPNFGVSISSAISSNTGHSMTIWLICVVLHVFPKKYFADKYHHHFRLKNVKSLRKDKGFLINAEWYTNMGETLALNGLSVFTSISNFPLHKFFFGSFLVLSFLHMIFMVYIQNPSWYKTKSIVYAKRSFLILSLILIPILLNFYRKHTYYCYPYYYSYFCLCEYSIVFLNIFFNIMAVKEFPVQSNEWNLPRNYKV